MRLSLLYVGFSIAVASATVAPNAALWRHPNHNVERQISLPLTAPSLTASLSILSNSTVRSTAALISSTPSSISLPLTVSVAPNSTAASSVFSLTSSSSSASNRSATSTVSVAPNSTVASSTFSLTSSSFSVSNTSTLTSSASPVSSTATSTSVTPTVSSSPQIQIFVFNVIEINININGKRAAVNVAGSADYILPNGGTTSSCGLASEWFIQNGQLFDLAGGQLGTSPGVSSEPFVASNNPGSITTTFTNTGNLAWDNGNFTDGTAAFCKATDQDGTIIVSFDGPSSPGSIGCTPVRLGITTCPASNSTGGNNIINNNNNVINNNNNVINNNNNVINNNNENNSNNNLINSGNTINNYNTYNVYDILPTSVINSFNTAAINYYCGDDTFYYAKICPSCPIVQVYKANDTYAEAACPVCPLEIMQCPGVIHVSTTNQVAPQNNNHSTASAGVCKYEAPICVSCETAPIAPPPSMTTVTVPCPSCPSSTTVVPCPVSIASSVKSMANAQGPAAAQSLASAANAQGPAAAQSLASAANTQGPAAAQSLVSAANTQGPAAAQAFASAANAMTATASGQTAAPSTVVNIPCTSCPAHSQATVIAQVAAGATSQPVSPAALPVPPITTARSSAEAGNTASTANPSILSSQVASFPGSASTIETSKLVATFTFLLFVAAML